MGLGPFASRYRCKCDGTDPTSAAIPSVLSISPVRERLEMCRREEEIWDIGRSRIRYKAASDALGLIAAWRKFRPR